MKVRISFIVDLPKADVDLIKADTAYSPFRGPGSWRQQLSRAAEGWFWDWYQTSLEELRIENQEWRNRPAQQP